MEAFITLFVWMVTDQLLRSLSAEACWTEQDSMWVFLTPRLLLIVLEWELQVMDYMGILPHAYVDDPALVEVYSSPKFFDT